MQGVEDLVQLGANFPVGRADGFDGVCDGSVFLFVDMGVFVSEKLFGGVMRGKKCRQRSIGALSILEERNGGRAIMVEGVFARVEEKLEINQAWLERRRPHLVMMVFADWKHAVPSLPHTSISPPNYLKPSLPPLHPS